ncbi:MAG: hypothetical protein SCH71_06115 [Desulfobulbaceae bacterium]|nr:hypothetical protein [Desulfobulbaceae bacterium]
MWPPFFCGAAVLLLFLPDRAGAFYTAGDDMYLLELRCTFNGGIGYARYPEDNFIYADSDEVLWSSDLRLLIDAAAGDSFRAEADIVQNIGSTPAFILPGSRAAALEVERSSVFFRQQHETGDVRAGLFLDSGSFSLGSPSGELIFGRQPINLSVTFYFTPNDFFAPFAPQNFYRQYKPGVDALRFEKRLADLTQFTLLTVLGYDEDPDSDSGWSREPNWHRTSLLGRITHIAGDYELGFFGGTLTEQVVVGASLQGDLFQWLGVRAEGNYRETWKDDLPDGLQLSIGLEHRFSPLMIGRLEQMHNGTGYASIREADEALRAGILHPGFLGRDYTAVDLSYEFTPLLTGEFLFLRNWTDSSQSLSVYGLYSLSDESELALTVTLPLGDEPDFVSLNSEFGVLPARFTLEYRHYF